MITQTSEPVKTPNRIHHPNKLESAFRLNTDTQFHNTRKGLVPSPKSPNTDLKGDLLLQDHMINHSNTNNPLSDSIPILSPPSSSSDRLSPPYPSSPSSSPRARSPNRHPHSFSPQSLVVDAQDVNILRKSATSHFRNLAYNVDSSKDAHFHLPGVTEDQEDVSGMLGRLRLQKTEDAESRLASRNWMDNQRKYLQAYEYLCHIGEAKEWIEECIDEDIPSVIQLEEALRDGVILAKLTRQFAPELVKRLYEGPKLHFRHTDNINYFFNFLEKVGMPNLFSFELTDLYDKKNIPRVIYCVHALGYILSNAGLAPPIGNLVGKLTFTDAELHDTQRGLDASGLKLPNFSSMGDHFGVDSEPEPEPELSEEEMILYELTQCEPEIVQLQSRSRGALTRISILKTKRLLTNATVHIVLLQAIIRGKKARNIVKKHGKRYAEAAPMVNILQSVIRAKALREQVSFEQHMLASSVPEIVEIQNIIRGKFARQDALFAKQIISSYTQEITELQSMIRGQMTREVVSYHFSQNDEVAPIVTEFQSILRGNLARDDIYTNMYILNSSIDQVVELQAILRGKHKRLSLDTHVSKMSNSEHSISILQSTIRGKLGRRNLARFKTAVLSYNRDPAVASLQSAIRAKRVQRQFAETMSALNHPSSHHAVVAPVITLQSIIKSKQLRSTLQTKHTQLTTANSDTVSLIQSIIRGKASRRQYFAHKVALRSCVAPAIQIQSAVRGTRFRNVLNSQRHALLSHVPEQIVLQGLVRGALVRKDMKSQIGFINSSSAHIAAAGLQSIVRAKNIRRELEDQKLALLQFRVEIITVQSALRGMLERARLDRVVSLVYSEVDTVNLVQANIRGLLLRKSVNRDLNTLEYCRPEILELQSVVRGGAVRNMFQDTLLNTYEAIPETLELQSVIRGGMVRQQVSHIHDVLYEEEQNVFDLQSAIRSNLVKQDYLLFMRQLDIHSPAIIRLQSAFRGVSTRFQYSLFLEEFDEAENSIIQLQAVTRGFMIRKSHNARMSHFKSNLDKIIKIQSFVRAKKQGDSYKSLITSPNPPLDTVKTFVHLLNDSDLDFEQEVHLEQSRKQVVQEVQHNEQLEQFISQLDVKIALLLKNKITIDEVVKHRNKAFANHNNYNSVANLAISTPADMFDLKALNKTSRRRLEMYHGLFYILQTQPIYFARLFKKLQRSVVSEKEAKEIERLTICVFDGPLPKKRREEYFFLKLIGASIVEESSAAGHNIKSVLRGNFMWWKLVAAMNRSSRERKTLKSLLYSPVTTLVTRLDLDLESDPLAIYRKSISDEEIRTGQLSQRNPNLTAGEAIKDPDTRAAYISNMQRLRELTTEFLNTVYDNVEHIPYHIRFVARELHNTCKTLFGNKLDGPQGVSSMSATMSRSVMVSEDRLLTVVGHVVFNLYLNPAIIAADNYGILGSALTPQQTRNLTEVTKMLSQIALLKPFSRDDVYLQPLNEYIKTSVGRMKEVFKKIINIPDVNQQFQMTIYDDLTSHHKPILAIKTSDIFAVHSLISAELESMVASSAADDADMNNILNGNGNGNEADNNTLNDPLRNVISELGTLPGDSSELLNITKFTEIKLELNSSFCPISDPSADINALMVETKRCLIYVLRVQTGSSLVDVLVSPVEDYHQHKFEQLLNEEESARKQKLKAKAEKKEQKLASLAKEIEAKQQQIVDLESGNFNPYVPESSTNVSEENADRKVEELESKIEELRQGVIKVREERADEEGDGKIGPGEHHLAGVNSSLGDLRSLSYRDLKRLTLEKVLELESYGKVSRENNYQDLLNSIAFDIRSKRDRRVERAREMGSVQSTLVSLQDKEKYLEQKLQTYNSYIEQSMATLQAKKAESGSKRQLFPFSKQYFHRKELQKSGTLPKFGSYKYSAATMAERGILMNLNVGSTTAHTLAPSVSLGGGLSSLLNSNRRGHHMKTLSSSAASLYPSTSNISLNPRSSTFSSVSPAMGLNVLSGGGGTGGPGSQLHLEKVSLTWSSDKVGVFKLEVAFGNVTLPGATTELSLDYLLSFQYNNRQYITLFENMLTLNTNLTLHFIFKKFYGQSM